jgi:hypothetical protein
MAGLWESFVTHQGRVAHKWSHYFPAYESHFSRFVNRPVVFWEIGVAEGGSLQLWKSYLGPLAQIVGLDIVDKTEFEEDQISIRVGDQSDTSVLDALLEEFGPPDVVLDDGSHVMTHIEASFRHLYPRMARDGVYMVEDLHTAYWPEYGGGLLAPNSFIETAKGLIDALNADTAFDAALQYREPSASPLDHSPPKMPAPTLSMHFYDSIVVFERGNPVKKHAPRIGGG